jgi:hypothetical protein
VLLQKLGLMHVEFFAINIVFYFKMLKKSSLFLQHLLLENKMINCMKSNFKFLAFVILLLFVKSINAQQVITFINNKDTLHFFIPHKVYCKLNSGEQKELKLNAVKNDTFYFENLKNGKKYKVNYNQIDYLKFNAYNQNLNQAGAIIFGALGFTTSFFSLFAVTVGEPQLKLMGTIGLAFSVPPLIIYGIFKSKLPKKIRSKKFHLIPNS